MSTAINAAVGGSSAGWSAASRLSISRWPWRSSRARSSLGWGVESLTRDYWADDLDRRLLAALEDRLEEYEQQSIEQDESKSMSTQETLDGDTDEELDVTAKTVMLSTYHLVGEDFNRKKAWEALQEAGLLDTGYEYFRRTHKEAIEGEHDVEEAVDSQVQSVIEPVLFNAGLLDQDTGETDEESDRTAETTEESESTQQIPPASASTSRSTGTTRGGVSVEDLRDGASVLTCCVNRQSLRLMERSPPVVVRRNF